MSFKPTDRYLPQLPTYTSPTPSVFTPPPVDFGWNIPQTVAPIFSHSLNFQQTPLSRYPEPAPHSNNPLTGRSIVPYHPPISPTNSFPTFFHPREMIDTMIPILSPSLTPKFTFENPLNPPLPSKPLYTDFDKFLMFKALQATQLGQGDPFTSQSHLPRLSKETLQSLATTYQRQYFNPSLYPNQIVITLTPVPAPKSSAQITVIGEEESASTAISTQVAKVAANTWTNIKIGFSYIGLENLDLPSDERNQILSAYSQSQKSKIPHFQDHIAKSLTSTYNIATQALRHLTPFPLIEDDLRNRNLTNPQLGCSGPYSYIDYVQSYDWIRFDPSHLVSTKSIPELVSKMAVFSHNMLIHGSKTHPLCHPTTQSFESKGAELIHSIRKIASQGTSGIIGTYLVNGINVQPKEFEQYVALRSRSFNNQVLTIGSYNTSYRLPWDFLNRVANESRGMENFSTEQMRNQLIFAAKTCDLLGKDYYFTFELHSEATLQYYNAFQKLSDSQKALVRSHILVLTLGGIRPIPDDFGKDVSNIYAEGDIALKNYGKHFLTNPNYTIKVVENLASSQETPLFIGPHAYLGKTYKVHSKQGHDDFGDTYHYLKLETN